MGASTFLACRVVDVGWSQVRRVYRFYKANTYDGTSFGCRVVTSESIRCKCLTLIEKCAYA